MSRRKKILPCCKAGESPDFDNCRDCSPKDWVMIDPRFDGRNPFTGAPYGSSGTSSKKYDVPVADGVYHAIPSSGTRGSDRGRVRFNAYPIVVGDKASGTYTIWNSTYDGLLLSEGHKRDKYGKYLAGGPLYVVHAKRLHLGSRRFNWSYGGTPHSNLLCGTTLVSSLKLLTPPSEASLTHWASVVSPEMAAQFATAYQRTRPGNPVASLGQFLIELRDLPTVPFSPRLFKGRSLRHPFGSLGLKARDGVDFFRKLGGEYLNVEFGWRPFVNDLRKLYELSRTVDKRLNQLIAENGRTIHRRATLQKTTSVTTGTQDGKRYNYPFYSCNGAPPSYWTGYTVVRDRTETTTEMWATSAWRYYVEDIGSPQWTARAIAALYGVLPTPELLWSVLPWSWLVDWFSNTGTVLSNLSWNAVDNLVLNGSFIMRHTVSRRITSCEGVCDGSSGTFKANNVGFRLESHEVVETKARIGGSNPFGWGVRLGDLNTRQLAILAALGISRSHVR